MATLEVASVYEPPAVDPARPWVCATNDWGATVLPDKPNWVVQVGNTLCVADNGTVVRVYAVPQ